MGGMPRFVLLRHELPPASGRDSHFDLMLERNGVLRTWACDASPLGGTVTATQLPDHRLVYLEYEGPVSDARGTVSRIESGTYQPLRESADEFRARLAGVAMRGDVTITREAPGSQRWRVEFSSA